MTVTSPSFRIDIKNEALKRRLVDCVTEEKKQFMQLAEVFYQSKRRNDADCQKLCQAMIAAIDQVLAADDWNNSLFLRNTLKPLLKIREQAAQFQEKLDGTQPRTTPQTPVLDGNTTTLYISLYQTNGHDLKQWALQLASITHHIIGRPVYHAEADAMQVIRTKLSQISEAYVIVAVERAKIITDVLRPKKDRFGHTLVNLLPQAVTPDAIIEFVHQSKRYYFKEQRLMPVMPCAVGA